MPKRALISADNHVFEPVTLWQERLPELFRARAQAAGQGATRPTGRAKACILLFMGGGPPQMDTFDLKPDAPAEVRGIFPPIATSVPGTQISELLPKLAQQAKHVPVDRLLPQVLSRPEISAGLRAFPAPDLASQSAETPL